MVLRVVIVDDVDGNECECRCDFEPHAKNERDEVAVVRCADAVVDPWTVVIVHSHARLADLAVPRSFRFHDAAFHADP